MRTIVRKTSVVAGILAMLVGILACGGEDRSEVSVELFGYNTGFSSGMPQFDGAEEVRIQVTNPEAGEVVNEQNIDIDRRTSRMPEVPGGPGMRLDFEVRGDDQPIASGATPTFNVDQDGDTFGFRTMISRVDEFAPVGSRQRDPETGEFKIVESTFDIRQYGDDIEWSGRLGHVAQPTESGEILIVGGARLGSDHEPGEMPVVRETFDDIQLFDPSTGYFTELAGDSDARSAGAEREDRLDQSRGFHTVTPVGDDRYVVAGGFRNREGSTVPVGSIELIDLNAEPGQRVQQLDGVEHLAEARGLHTATYRESDGRVVIAGGMGSSSSDAVGTIEMIDPESPDLESGIGMQSSRLAHEAVLLEDGETIWLIGGTDGSNALGSTETIDETNTTRAGPSLETARYGASAAHLGEEGNNQVVVLGGVTSGGPTANYEMGNPLGGGDLNSGGAWELDQARAGARTVVLPQSGDVAVIGGYDSDLEPLGSAARMTLVEELPPFEVDTDFGEMHHVRSEPAISLASNGRIILVAGDDPDGVERNDAEYFNIYDPVEP